MRTGRSYCSTNGSSSLRIPLCRSSSFFQGVFRSRCQRRRHRDAGDDHGGETASSSQPCHFAYAAPFPCSTALSTHPDSIDATAARSGDTRRGGDGCRARESGRYCNGSARRNHLMRAGWRVMAALATGDGFPDVVVTAVASTTRSRARRGGHLAAVAGGPKRDPHTGQAVRRRVQVAGAHRR